MYYERAQERVTKKAWWLRRWDWLRRRHTPFTYKLIGELTGTVCIFHDPCAVEIARGIRNVRQLHEAMAHHQKVGCPT